MRDKMQRFMYGRYGNDDLNRAISIVTIISIILDMITRFHILYWISLALLIILYYRMMSRNTSVRWAENQKYLQFRSRVTGLFRGSSSRTKPDPNYRIMKCPQCQQKVRVPKGKGKIRIHCPKCGNDFIKKS